jgi:glycosyltransferase A (GT-A) superfamily protein (DUF2064 family)
MTEQLCAVAIMAKASVAGTVKTRLVPPLTCEEAAEFNTCCLTDVAANIVAAAAWVPIQGFAAYHPPGSERFFYDLLPVGFKLLPPKEATIGRSLFHAAQDLFAAGYRSVCLVNADSPTLPTEVLVEAVRLLREPGDRVVLGPAADGGYYLIGLKRFHRRLFEEIDWSAPAKSECQSLRCPYGTTSMTTRRWRCSLERCSRIPLPQAPIAAAIRRRAQPPFSSG